MADRFKNNLYMLTRYKRIEGHLCTISNDDGTLFSGCFKTKIRPTDLPEWYLYGRYYKRWVPSCGFPTGTIRWTPTTAGV